MKENLLFICSRNQWRSPTAEKLFRNHPYYAAKSAGTSPRARIRLTARLIAWSDVLLVMERKHQRLVRERFGEVIGDKTVIVLGIEDRYAFGDPALITLLKEKLADAMGIVWES